MKQLAQRLRHRVTIEQVTETRDADGGVVTTWAALHSKVPAEIVPLSGREFIAAQAAQAGVNARMTIRYVDGITPKMRVVHGPDIYNIEAVLPDPTLRRHLTLMVSTGVNNG